MYSNLSNHQIKKDHHTHRLLYMKLLVTTNKKTYNKYIAKEKEFKGNTKESHQHKGREEE